MKALGVLLFSIFVFNTSFGSNRFAQNSVLDFEIHHDLKSYTTLFASNRDVVALLGYYADAGTVEMWNISTRSKINTFKVWEGAAALSADGKRLAIGHRGIPQLSVYDTETGTLVYESRLGDWFADLDVQFSPKGDLIILRVEVNSNYFVLDAKDGHKLYGITSSGLTFPEFSPSGDKIVTFSDGTITVREPKSGVLLKKYQEYFSDSHHHRFSSENTLYLSSQSELKEFNIETGKFMELDIVNVLYPPEVPRLTYLLIDGFFQSANGSEICIWSEDSSNKQTLVRCFDRNLGVEKRRVYLDGIVGRNIKIFDKEEWLIDVSPNVLSFKSLK